MEQSKSPFSFEGYKISRSEMSLSDSNEESTEMNIGITAKVDIKENHFFLNLDTTVSSKDESVYINVIMTGEFVFNDNISSEILNGLFTANAPAIMFPYIRAYISTLTGLSGSAPVIIPTIQMTPLRAEILKGINDAEL